MERSWIRPSVALVALTALLTLTAAATAQPTQGEKTPTAIGRGGAAATVDVLATQAALDALRDGANAVDAAVIAAGVLGVVEPFSCGIGGGGFMVIRTSDGKVTTIDHRETAPAAMRPGSYGHRFSTTGEIGAVTGIKFLGGGFVLAAAEPARRGGGSAMVEEPG